MGRRLVRRRGADNFVGAVCPGLVFHWPAPAAASVTKEVERRGTTGSLSMRLRVSPTGTGQYRIDYDDVRMLSVGGHDWHSWVGIWIAQPLPEPGSPPLRFTATTRLGDIGIPTHGTYRRLGADTERPDAVRLRIEIVEVLTDPDTLRPYEAETSTEVVLALATGESRRQHERKTFIFDWDDD